MLSGGSKGNIGRKRVNNIKITFANGNSMRCLWKP